MMGTRTSTMALAVLACALGGCRGPEPGPTKLPTETVSAAVVETTDLPLAAPEIPAVPSGHPRVYVRPDLLPGIRAKRALPEFRTAWQSVRKGEDPFSKAFVYLLDGEREVGRAAVTEALQNLAGETPLWNGKLTKDGRPFRNHMHIAACVYDWCYDLLTDEEKQRYIQGFKDFFAGDHNRGYPPNRGKLNTIIGHDSEGCIMSNLLPAGVAVYDETPELYDLAAGIYFERYIASRNFQYQAHMHHQGHHYAGERYQHDIGTTWLFRRMGAGEIFSRHQQYVPYEFLYFLRPDRKFFASGDGGDDAGIDSMKRVSLGFTGAYYRDPYLLTLFDDPEFRRSPFVHVFDLLFLEPGMERRPLAELPTTKYFGYPMGDMVARTGWTIGTDDSRDAVVHMRINQHYFGNHQHMDSGTFQIYYRGPLAIDTGIYWGSKETCYGSPHWRNYYQQTIAHNGLLIVDPATADEDHGGQRRHVNHGARTYERFIADSEQNRYGVVTGHAFGPDSQRPEYSYLSGDITNAYLKSKAERVRRSMAALGTGVDGRPLVFAVYDEVTAASPEFKKAFYLHSIQEPVVDGRTVSIVRDGPALWGRAYGGKLVLEALLPEEMRIDRVGGSGRECWNEVTSENYMPKTNSRPKSSEIGAWRVELVPTVPAKQHRFLNIMTVMDRELPAPEVLPIRTERAVGARVLNRAVVFRSSGNAAESLCFDVPGEGTVGLLVCGVASGMWEITLSDGSTIRKRVEAEADSLYLKALVGKCTLMLKEGKP